MLQFRQRRRNFLKEPFMSNDPFRKLNEVERGVRKAVNTPQQEMRGNQQQINQAMRAPEQAARRAKYNALSPVRQIQSQKRSMQSQGRRYKRYGKRLSSTDFTISALMYPTGFLALIGSFIEDWDTEHIRWHMVHARVLWLILFILFIGVAVFSALSIAIGLEIVAVLGLPVLALPWLYCWYLGFQAYSGKKSRIPLITNWLENHGKLDLDPAE
jgi:uncharacterized membrane protein